MSNEQKTNWLTRVVKAILWLILLTIISIVLFIFWLFGKADPSLKLRNYEELNSLRLEPNSRPDGKVLPFYDVVSTNGFWHGDYKGNIPNPLQADNIIIAQNRDGFVDLINIALIKLDEESVQALLSEVRSKFDLEAEGRGINLYVENALCLNHADFGPWVISSKRKQGFFDFCLDASQTKKIDWQLTLHNEDGVGFEYIGVTHYVGTNYFTVTHGGS